MFIFKVQNVQKKARVLSKRRSRPRRRAHRFGSLSAVYPSVSLGTFFSLETSEKVAVTA
jgi:hypothetical protein